MDQVALRRCYPLTDVPMLRAFEKVALVRLTDAGGDVAHVVQLVHRVHPVLAAHPAAVAVLAGGARVRAGIGRAVGRKCFRRKHPIALTLARSRILCSVLLILNRQASQSVLVTRYGWV